ncbi:MAG: helix-turn-helix domain-containing protein [Actinophytocola sp.]|nr:helix-turn-helix domain-containing protein [Actinophytocola sp.]
MVARESEQVALLRRKLGVRLQLARATAGLTQSQLAIAAFRDRTTVAHIEKGRLRADDGFWATADQMCGTDGALLTAYAELQAMQAKEEVKQREAVLAEAQAQLDRLSSLDAATSERTGTEEHGLARLDTTPLNEDRHVGAALGWLDRAAGWSPGTARRAVAARFAAVDVGQVRDLALHRGRVGQREVAEVLRSYYSDTVDGYGTYEVTVDGGATVGTSVVTRPDWLDLGCVLTPDTDRLRFSASLPAPAARLDEQSADRAVNRLAETLAIGTRLIDLPLYWLAELDVSGGNVAGRLGVTQFAHFGLTLDLLESELLGALASGTSELPLRDKYLPDMASVVDFSRRLCIVGVVAVCAIARPPGPHGDADYLMLAQRRSGHVVNAARRLALIPRGFHQPLADYRDDARIRVTVLREMEEELFGRDDVDNTSGDQRSADPMHPSRLSEPMTWLLEHPDRLRIECTGLGLNTVNGNHDIACLIVIEDEQFWTQYGGLIEANWESSSLHRYSTRDPESIADLITDEAWTAEGPFALTQGLRRLTTTNNPRTDLPHITWSLT